MSDYDLGARVAELEQLLRETEAALIEEQEKSARRGDALDLLARAELKDGPCWCDFEQEHVEGPSLACRLARVALEVGS